MDKELEELERDVEEELVCAIFDFAEDPKAVSIRELQPPSTIIRAMAKAAAQVLMAFERGYRMSGE